MKQLRKYVVIGGVGFVIDLLAYLLLSHLMIHHIARLLAFLFAVYATYKLNGQYTFPDRVGRFHRYALGQTVGIGVNFLVYEISLIFLGGDSYVIAFMLGSAVALIFNYLAATIYAFRSISES